MAIYFVDYENVGSAGVDGVDYLSDQDEIKIFYSNHADTLKYEQVKQLLSTKAKVDLLKIETGTANALDFQLVAMLYYTLEGDEPRYIISRDTGYDMAVKMGEQLGAAGVVKRCISIKKALNDRARAEQAARKAENRAEEPEKTETAEPKKDSSRRSQRREEPKRETARREDSEKSISQPVQAEPEKAGKPEKTEEVHRSAHHEHHEPVKAEPLTREPVRYEAVQPKKDDLAPSAPSRKEAEKAEKAEKTEKPEKSEKETRAPKETAKQESEAPVRKEEKKPAFEIKKTEGAGKASASGILDGYTYAGAEAPKAKSVVGASVKAVLGQGPKIFVKTMEGGKQIGEAKEAEPKAAAEPKPAKKEKPAREERPQEKPSREEKSSREEKHSHEEKPVREERTAEKPAREKQVREERTAEVEEKNGQEKPAREHSSRRRERGQNRNTELKQDEEYLKKIRYIADDVQRHTGMRLNSSQCEMVLDALKASEGKDDFYHFFQQKLGNKKGQVFYQQIRSRFRHLKDKLAPWQPPAMFAETKAEEPAPAVEAVREEEVFTEEEPAAAQEVTAAPAAEPVPAEEPAPAQEEKEEEKVSEETAPAQEPEEAPAKEEKAPVRAETLQEKPVKPNVSENAGKDNSILGRLGRLLGR